MLSCSISKNNVKRDIYQGDIEDLKKSIIKVIKKQFKVNNVYIHEPEIKICDLTQCEYCNKCIYTTKDLFAHCDICEEYKEADGKAYKIRYLDITTIDGMIPNELAAVYGLGPKTERFGKRKNQ